MRINLISDLHSDEDYIYKHPKVGADILVVAGDIGDNENIMDKFDSQIIWVDGNHDVWGKTAREVMNNPRITVYKTGDYVFVALTLWTNFWVGITRLGEFETITRSLNDFNYIHGMTIKTMMELYERDLKVIEDIAKANTDKKIIVCTHFAPSKKAIHKQYKGNALNKYFCNDLDDFILENKNIKLWCFGHTHTSMDFMVGQCRCVCNPRGYEGENPKFNPKLVIEI